MDRKISSEKKYMPSTQHVDGFNMNFWDFLMKTTDMVISKFWDPIVTHICKAFCIKLHFHICIEELMTSCSTRAQ